MKIAIDQWKKKYLELNMAQMKCYACSGSGLGYVWTYQTPITHTYTPITPANTPAHYLHIYGHGANTKPHTTKSTQTRPEVHG